MELLDINNLLNREEEVNKIKDILTNFEANKSNLAIKKGIYIYVVKKKKIIQNHQRN